MGGEFRKYSETRLNDRKIDELIGLCKGIISDGVIVDAEVEYLMQWLDNNRDVKDIWPASVIYSRMAGMLLDGMLDDEDERALLKTLMDVTGGPVIQAEISSMSSMLPLCDPAPTVEFKSKTFCMTGEFLAGKRGQVEGMILMMGGNVSNRVTLKTDYLVVGSIGSKDWMHSTHGRKIEEAVALRTKGVPIRIVSEEHWCSFLS